MRYIRANYGGDPEKNVRKVKKHEKKVDVRPLIW